MDMSSWTIAGVVAVAGLLLLRYMLAFGKRRNDPHKSQRMRRVEELRRRVSEREKANPDPKPDPERRDDDP